MWLLLSFLCSRGGFSSGRGKGFGGSHWRDSQMKPADHRVAVVNKGQILEHRKLKYLYQRFLARSTESQIVAVQPLYFFRNRQVSAAGSHEYRLRTPIG